MPYYRIDRLTSTKFQIGTVAVEVQNFEFEMETLKLGDYLPVAIIEHDVVVGDENVTNIVRMINNTEKVKKEWLTVKGHCDDCNDTYNRKKTVILKNFQGEYRQVGTGCLKKYVGIDCFDIISVYGSVTELVDEELHVEGYSNTIPNSMFTHTRDYLAACIDVIKKDKAYHTSNEANSTAKQAREIVEDQSPINSYVEADEIIDFYKKLIASNDYENICCSGFDKDICNACITEYSRIGDGRVAYAYVAYTTLKNSIAKRKEEEENKNKSQYVGNVGDKINITAKYDKCIAVRTVYGLSYICIFVDEKGNEFTWFTSTVAATDMVVGNIYKLTGKVKEHKEYDGKKQTALTRVKTAA